MIHRMYRSGSSTDMMDKDFVRETGIDAGIDDDQSLTDTVVVTADEAGLRLDSVLASRYNDTSRSYIANLIEVHQAGSLDLG